MRIFVYEFITGGGLLTRGDGQEDQPLAGSLLKEGTAMVSALTEDFARLDSVEVLAMRDHRLRGLSLPGCEVTEVGSFDFEQTVFNELAAEADWTVLIAPEFDELLLERCRRVLDARGRLMSPGIKTVSLCSDKQRTAEHLAAAGVAVPQGQLIEPGENLPRQFPYPAVVKPVDGAGSEGVELVESFEEHHSFAPGKTYRIERFCEGLPVSVSILCGPKQKIVMPACRQLLGDGSAALEHSAESFVYQGGHLPLEKSLAPRAVELAKQAVDSLTDVMGYVGVDLVLGPDESGSQDVVIEINPRLTTSYVGLRAAAQSKLARGNLARAMLDLAQGQTCEMEFSSEPIRFYPDGTIEAGCAISGNDEVTSWREKI